MRISSASKLVLSHPRLDARRRVATGLRHRAASGPAFRSLQHPRLRVRLHEMAVRGVRARSATSRIIPHWGSGRRASRALVMHGPIDLEPHLN